MAHANLPITTRVSTDDNTFADVVGNDNAILAQLNGNLDNSNIAAAAGIAHSKLANSTAGNLLLANASGVITGTAMSGDATISNAGAVTLAANSVGTAEITDANVTDAKLASPNNSVYRTITEASGGLHSSSAVTYLLGSHRATAGMMVGGSSELLDVASQVPNTFYLDDADYAVAGKTTRLRVRGLAGCNATAPAVNFTFGLYPVTIAGGANAIGVTPGTVVTSSTVAINAPSASVYTTGVSSDFSFPSDGAYVLAVAVSGVMAADTAMTLHAQLQMRHT